MLSVILQEVEALNSFVGTPETQHFMEAFVIGTLICPNLDEIPYDFILQLDNIGGGNIVVGSPRGQQGVGQIVSSSVSSQFDLSSFSLEAIVEDATCSGPIQQQKLVVLTASGNCGLSETISFSTNAGITGTFSGRVACI